MLKISSFTSRLLDHMDGAVNRLAAVMSSRPYGYESKRISVSAKIEVQLVRCQM